MVLQTTMKPHQTLRTMLLHTKDMSGVEDTAGVVYQILFKDRVKIYMWETGSWFWAREKDHKRDVNSLEEVTFNRSRKTH